MSTSTDETVLSILENIKKTDSTNTNASPNSIAKKRIPQTKRKGAGGNIAVNNAKEIKGKPKSGRFWKSKKERFSSIVKTKGIKPDFPKKTALRLELKRTKELSRQLLEQIKEKEKLRKERRRENLKRAEENKRKSEIVQQITNTAKLKRMKKKQLRFIEKRDTNKEIKSDK